MGIQAAGAPHHQRVLFVFLNYPVVFLHPGIDERLEYIHG